MLQDRWCPSCIFLSPDAFRCFEDAKCAWTTFSTCRLAWNRWVKGPHAIIKYLGCIWDPSEIVQTLEDAFCPSAALLACTAISCRGDLMVRRPASFYQSWWDCYQYVIVQLGSWDTQLVRSKYDYPGAVRILNVLKCARRRSGTAWQWSRVKSMFLSSLLVQPADALCLARPAGISKDENAVCHREVGLWLRVGVMSDELEVNNSWGLLCCIELGEMSDFVLEVEWQWLLTSWWILSVWCECLW